MAILIFDGSETLGAGEVPENIQSLGGSLAGQKIENSDGSVIVQPTGNRPHDITFSGQVRNNDAQGRTPLQRLQAIDRIRQRGIPVSMEVRSSTPGRGGWIGTVTIWDVTISPGMRMNCSYTITLYIESTGSAASLSGASAQMNTSPASGPNINDLQDKANAVGPATGASYAAGIQEIRDRR